MIADTTTDGERVYYPPPAKPPYLAISISVTLLLWYSAVWLYFYG